jgi:ferric-dicitrate binding protein FerR (iron transport regulator)
MSYCGFAVEDFVLDKHFRHWVLTPDVESNVFWNSWLQHNPDKGEVIQEARAIILNMPRINYGWSNELEDSMWQSIVEETQKTQKEEQGSRIEKANSRVVPLHVTAMLGSIEYAAPRRQWYHLSIVRIAATLLLVLTFSIGSYFVSQESKESVVAICTVEAPWGKKETFDLPDGSKVQLNAGSAAHFPERFSEKERLIEIRGEAFIEVKKDRLRPFRVKTGILMTEALGTAFNVNCQEESVEISLVEGKVEVSVVNHGKKEERLILMPGEQASLQNENCLVKDVFNVEKVTAWKHGMIFFISAGQEEVINTLEQWYGVKITLQGQTSKPWNFTGKFKGKSLEYVLKSVSYTMKFDFKIEGDKVKITYL